ncbi:MAG: restriction endonuclease subunit S, partial [Smithellaceae bacterium]|nr:restriction endonuclease subunit S [Smithellaceae bacterium]
MKYQPKKIGDIASIKGGKRLPKGMFVIDGPTPHPYLRIVDFADYGVDRSNIKYIDAEVFEKIKRYTIDKTDIYISIAGTIGRVGIVPDDLSGANLTENAAKITNISGDIYHRYLMYYLRSSVGQGQILNRTVGTSQPKLALYRIADIDFPCPPMPVQKKVAKFLSAYDNLIENNRRRIQLLEQAARLLYKEWFVHLRFPGHEHTKIIDGVPEGWEGKVLGDVCFDVRETVFPNTLEPNTPYIGLEHMPRRSITLCEWGQAGQVTSSKRRFREGEILFGKIRPYFHKVGIALTDGVASSDAIIIRPTNPHLMVLVLMATSSDGFVAVTAQQMKEGSKMPRADWKQMQQYPVLVPPDGLLRA